MYTEKETQLAKIKICDLSMATGCNFKCKMCYFWKPQHSGNENFLSNKDWENVIDQITQLPNRDIKLIFSGGGEVLMRPGIEDLLRYASKDFLIALNTNAYLIDRRMAKILASTAQEVNISLDGIKAQTHDYLRGMPGSFETVLKAIEYLRAESRHMLININTVILAQNLGELVELVKWVDNQPVDGLIFQAVTMPSNTPHDQLWYMHDFSFLWPQDHNQPIDIIDQLIALKQKGSKIVNSLNQLECFKAYFSNPKEAVNGFKCEVDRALKIDNCGNIKMCDYSQPIGNVKTTSLTEMLTSHLAEEERVKAYQCKSPCHLLVNCFHDNGGE